MKLSSKLSQFIEKNLEESLNVGMQKKRSKIPANQLY